MQHLDNLTSVLTIVLFLTRGLESVNDAYIEPYASSVTNVNHCKINLQ